MKIIDMLLTPNIYSRPTTPLKSVSKLALHYVGNAGSTAAANRNYFESLKDKKTTYASSHYIIGLDGEIIRCIPENEIAYCTNAANNYSISIENCHPAPDGKFNQKTLASLTELCADICKRYNLDPIYDIIRHYDVTGKMCPLYWVKNPADFEMFKVGVKKVMGAETTAIEIKDVATALERLVKVGVITDKAHWTGLIAGVKWLPELLINAAKKCGNKKTGNITTGAEALKKAQEAGVVNSPDYWRDYAFKVLNNAEKLFINIANFL